MLTHRAFGCHERVQLLGAAHDERSGACFKVVRVVLNQNPIAKERMRDRNLEGAGVIRA